MVVCDDSYRETTFLIIQLMIDMKRDDSSAQNSVATVNLTEVAQGLLDPGRPTALIDHRERTALLSSIQGPGCVEHQWRRMVSLTF